MATYKMTYIFHAQKAGWSESWYMETDSLSVATDNARVFGLKRMRLLGNGAQLEAVKTSDIAVPGDAHIHKFTDEEKDAYTVSYGANTDTPWNAIYCRVLAGKDYHRAFHLRGVPDNIIAFSIERQRWVSLSDTFTLQFQNWLDWMRRTPPIRIRATSKNPTESPLFTVTQVDRFDAGKVKLWLSGNHGLPDGAWVRIRNLRFGGANLGGRRRVITEPQFTNTLMLNLLVPDGTATLRPDNATLRKEFITYPAVSDVIIDRASKKSTGRAFFSPVGRRRARR